jgi:hypothetical protein
MINDDPVSKFMTTMRQDVSGNVYSPHTQFRDIMSVSNSMRVDGVGYGDDDFTLFEQQAGFGGYGNQPSVPSVRRSSPVNYNQRNIPQYQQQPVLYQENKKQNGLLDEIYESMMKNPVNPSGYVSQDVFSQQGLIENTRMDLFESSVNNPQQNNIPYNSQINEVVNNNYQSQPIQNQFNPPATSLGVDYAFINKIVKDAINEGLNNKPQNIISLIKDGQKYEGKIAQQKSGRILFILNDGENAFELFMGDKRKLKK